MRDVPHFYFINLHGTPCACTRSACTACLSHALGILLLVSILSSPCDVQEQVRGQRHEMDIKRREDLHYL